MKKIKMNLLAIIGMVVAVATLAFTAPKNIIDNPNEDPLWYYTGTTSDDEGDAQMYEPSNGEESCPGFDEVICLISAPLDVDGVSPDLTKAQTLSHKF